MRARAILVGLCLAATAALGAAPAHAERVLIAENAVDVEEAPGGIEGACGVAIASGKIYVSDYYHHSIAVFGSSGSYLSRIAANPLDGPCQLATSAGGALYANDWHEGVSRVLPTGLSFDSAESTGVAVDQSTGRVYVDDRTYVAVYEPSGAPVLGTGSEPLRIGLGTLVDGYGIAVAGGKVYVPDAADNAVKVYEPASDPVNPAAVIDGAATPQGRFVSLVDAAVAVDPTNGHLVVLDNLQPGFEFPQGAIEEFDSAGNFLGQLPKKVIHGEPGGLAFLGGNLYATSGNSELSTVLEFAPYAEGGSGSALPPAPDEAAAPASTTQATPETSAPPSVDSLAGSAGATPALRLAAASIGGDGAVTVAVVLRAEGTLAATGRSLQPLRRPVGPGRTLLHLHPDRRARRALARGGQLKVRLRIVFTPDSGAALHAGRTLILGSDGRDGR